MQLCYALLSDGLPFKFLENENPNGLATLLRSVAGVDVSHRVIRDMIPDVMKMENDTIAKQINQVDFMSVIFDATPDLGEAFGVVVRSVNSLYDINHICIDLVFYDTVFDHEKLGKSNVL